MFSTTFEIHAEVYKYSYSAYINQVSFFYGDSVIKSSEGTQQGDPESPASFSDSIQDFIDSLPSKINLWYLDDVNLGDDYRTVLKNHKQFFVAKKLLGLRIKRKKYELLSLVTSLKNDGRQF